MKILILGGTQFVGKHIVSECLNREHDVTLFNRGITNPNTKVETLHGDRQSNNYSELSNRKWDVVIDVPSFKPDVVKGALDYLYDNVNLYAFISTVSVYDIDKYNDVVYNNYCKDKIEAERLFHGKELKSLIFRPGILCGEGDNTQRFDYYTDGIFWRGNRNKVEDYMMVEDFAKFVLDLVEKNKRGVYECI